MHLPIHLSIEGRLCLLVGNGPFVRTLIPKLAAHGAHLRLIDLPPDPSTAEQMPGSVEIWQNPYRREDLDDVFLVVTDAADPEINARVAADARAAGALLMRGDLPLPGDFMLSGAQTSEPILTCRRTALTVKDGSVKKYGLAGIPITDREFGSSFGVYTIHKNDGAGLSEEQWRRMAQGPDTLVLLMGKTMLATVAGKLVRQGRPAATPVALITDGTTSRQKRFIGTLATIVEEVDNKADGSEGPGLIVVGEVVSVFSGMEWFRPDSIPEFAGGTDHETAFALLSRLMEGVAA